MATLEEALLAQKRLQMEHTPELSRSGTYPSKLELAAMLASPIPYAGAALGTAADAEKLKEEPSWSNLGFLGANIVPFGRIFRKTKEAMSQGKDVVYRGTMGDWDLNPHSPSFGSKDPGVAYGYAAGGPGEKPFLSPESKLKAYELAADPKRVRDVNLLPGYEGEPSTYGALSLSVPEARRTGVVSKPVAREIFDRGKQSIVTDTDTLQNALREGSRWDAFRLNNVLDLAGSENRMSLTAQRKEFERAAAKYKADNAKLPDSSLAKVPPDMYDRWLENKLKEINQAKMEHYGQLRNLPPEVRKELRATQLKPSTIVIAKPNVLEEIKP